MADELDPKGAADVFASQILTLIAMANALVECGVVDAAAFISALEHQRAKMGMPEKPGDPLTSLIRSLQFGLARKSSDPARNS